MQVQIEQVIQALEQMFPKELQIAVQAVRIQELEAELAAAQEPEPVLE